MTSLNRVSDCCPGESLTRALRLEPGEMLALCGGGGKTSLLHALAAERPFGGGLFTTTTKMFNPEGTSHPFDRICLDWNSSAPPAGWEKETVFAAGEILPGGVPGNGGSDSGGRCKVRGLPARLLESWREMPSRPVLIVEADGASRKPVKYPGPKEPVIPRNTDHVAGCIGMEILGQRPTPALVHRVELFLENLPLDENGLIGLETLSALIEGDRGLFKNCPTREGVKRTVILNKFDLLPPSCDIHKITAVLKYRFPDHRFLITQLNLSCPVIHTV